jgi:hypothetical protein
MCWHREKLPRFRETHHSQQYLKAWRAGFPEHLWPAKEEATCDGLFLVLKDGTKLLATGTLLDAAPHTSDPSERRKTSISLPVSRLKYFV